MNSFDDVGSPV